MSYYFTLDGKNVQGPTTLEQLAEWVRQSKLPPTVYVCQAGAQDWKHLNAVVPAIQLAPTSADAVGVSTESVASEAPQPAQASQAVQPAPADSQPRAQAVQPESTYAVAAHQAQAQESPAVQVQSETSLATTDSNTALAESSLSDLSALAISAQHPVDPKTKKSPGTGLHTAVGYGVVGVFLLIVVIGLIIATWGIALLVAGISYWLALRRGHAQIHGGSVHVTEDQFPEIHRCVEQFADRLGMKSVPEVYVVEGSVINAFAAKLGKRKYVLLLDEIVHGALETGDPNALAFIIGHEMAHHALGHTSLMRGAVSTSYKALSRCDELTCDAVAADLVDNPQVSKLGLAMLLVGPQLVRMLNWRALDRQARELMSKKTWKGAESSLSHPLLLRRYAALTGLQ